jgi:hypothetical protein
MTVPLLLLSVVLALPTASPACWIRDDPADLELRISPLDSITTVLGTDTIRICYSRPRMLGRPIMGRLVPFGAAWRLGANEATVLHTPVPLVVGDARVPAGSYSLYAIPDRDEWRLVVNATAQRWGVPISGGVREADRDTTTARVGTTPEPVEMFTMRFEPTAGGRVELVMEWERTRLRVPIRRAEP